MMDQFDFEDVIDSLPGVVTVVSPNGIVVYGNARIFDLFGYEVIDIVGSDFNKMLPERLRAGFIDYLETQQTFPSRLPLSGRRKDGSEFPIELTINKLTRSVPHLFCLTIGSGQSESAFSRSLADAPQALVEMQQTESLILSLSHDLKSPLTGSVRVLEQILAGTYGNAAPEVFEVLKVVETTQKAMLNWLQTLTEILLMERDIPSLLSNRVELCDLIRSSTSLLAEVARLRDVNIMLTLPDMQLFMLGDPGLLSRAVQNLVDNAIKFSPSGETVSIKAEAQESQAVIRVHNRCSRMKSEDRKALFKKFLRTSRTHERLGGLGLYYAHRLIALHGGELLILHEHDCATSETFCIRLPLAPDQS